LDIRKRLLAKIIARCWLDDDLKQRLLADPISTLAEFKIDLTHGMRVKTVIDTETCFHLVLPSPPWIIPTHLTLFPYLDDDAPQRQRTLGELNVRLWEDPALKARLTNSPREVLAQEGLNFPDGVTIEILENSAKKMYLSIPLPPSGFSRDQGLEVAEKHAGSRILGVLSSSLY